MSRVMKKKIYLILLVVSLSAVSPIISVANGKPYTADQLQKKLEWVSRSCKKPEAPPPKPLRTISYNDMAKMSNNAKYIPKYISYRRWINTNGNGNCDIYDVGMPVISSASDGKFYGYPTRIISFSKGHWKIIKQTGLGWIPVVLKDKNTGKIYLWSVTYGGLAGDIGGWPIANWGEIRYTDCQTFHKEIYLAYMFAFHPPPEFKSDELMSQTWTGGNQLFMVFPGLKSLTENSKTLSCIKPYLRIAKMIDERAHILYPFDFSSSGWLREQQ